MVEKSKPANGLAKDNIDGQRATGGILKKVARSLESVPESKESSSIEGHDASSNIPTERNHLSAKEEETSKFKTLCEGVQNQLALFQVSMVELLALKDELIKHALPPSLLVKVALVTSKLFRGASDLAVPVNELVRLVKLYSAPWESKSAALKKLHEDYENKQRQLNVALQKLVLVGIQADRMSQERRVLNWERLFTRIMTSKAHGYRWKFLIESFKKKIKTGEIYEAGASTDEDTEKEKAKNARQLEKMRRKYMSKDTTPKQILKESITIEGAKRSVLVKSSPHSTPEKEIKEEQLSSEDELISDIDISVKEEEELTSLRRIPDQPMRNEMKSSQQLFPSKPEMKPRPKISFSFKPPSDDDDDDSDEIQSADRHGMFRGNRTQKPALKRTVRTNVQFTQEKAKPKPKSRLRGVKFFSPSDDEEEETKPELKQPQPSPEIPKILTEDKECWTNEPDCERFLHVRLYRPVCKKADSPSCTVVFMGHALKTNTYDPPLLEQSIPHETSTEQASRVSVQGDVPSGEQSSVVTSSSLEEPPRFEELRFKLPDNNGYAPGEKPMDLSEEQLKVAIHPSPEQPMVAMAAMRYSDLKILDQFEGRWSHTDFSCEIQSFPLMSTLSDRDMPFGSECGHVPVVCYMSKIESPKMQSKETATESFEQLIRKEIEERRKAEMEEQQAAMRGASPPRYTESEFQSIRDAHAEEVQSLHEEYERRLNELAQGLDSFRGNEEGIREFVNAATSPLLMRSPSPLRSSSSVHSTLRAQSALTSQSAEQHRTPRPPSETRPTTTSRKGRPRIPNLPEWGKDLPQDFLVRLDMFNENSEKYHLELEDKTKKAIQQKYELQMAVQNRLSIPDDQHFLQEEVCLPAVFMPTKTGLVFSPKAHSYFHPPGSSEGRLTQPPSVFKLPHLKDAPPHVSVLNLFDMGHRFTSRPQNTPSGTIPQTAPPALNTHDMESPAEFIGRAYTR